MQRFFLENLETTNYSFILKDLDMIHQLSRVLRSKPGDKIIFFNGIDFWDYVFEIKDIKKTEILLEQVDRIKKDSEITFDLNLFQAIPNKMDKIELIIKNGVQIGVSNFLFFKAERSQKLVISDKKIERLNKIIIEAVEQSGRNKIPSLVIGEKINFILLEGQKLFLHTKNQDSVLLKDIKIEKNEILNLFIGPEGGFSDDEIWRFGRNDFKSVFLGERILRTELAGISSSFYLIQNNL